ncbi:MAG: glycoside hydrolase family 127 protein, partial [Gemmatimonadota bacterium]
MSRASLITCLLLAAVATACEQAQPPDYPVQPVPFTQVRFEDDFWAARLETNRTVTIPHVFAKCEETGRIDNFAIAGGLMEGEQRGAYPFDDTDVYKTIEGASYSLMLRRDPVLEAYLDSVIALIAAAQEPDGYLYTARTNNAGRLRRWFGDERWERLEHSHELYNAGHLYEAAAAHHLATGKRNLLEIALKNADLIDRTFGPGKLRAPPGHEVIEMGLVRLYRVTGERRYLDLAKFFIDVRGRPLDGRTLGGEYNQDHKPVVEQTEAVGHAVRAGYL